MSGLRCKALPVTMGSRVREPCCGRIALGNGERGPWLSAVVLGRLQSLATALG